MKLVFTKLETDANEIKVTFDGLTWRPYNVDDIKRAGYIEFTEEDCSDLTKIRVKGKFASFNSVEAVSDVELEQGLASKELAESVQNIYSLISENTSETNKLADKAYVTSEVGKDTVVETGHNANGYYRKYKSGYIKQWGTLSLNKSISGSDNWSPGNIDFPVAFTSVNANVVIIAFNQQMNTSIDNVTKTTFCPRFRCINDSNSATLTGANWQARGF